MTAPHFLKSTYFGVKSDHKKAVSVGQSVWGSWIIVFTGWAVLTWQLPQWRGFFPLIFIADKVISIIKDICFTELCCFLPNINMNTLLHVQQCWAKEVFNHHTMFPPWKPRVETSLASVPVSPVLLLSVLTWSNDGQHESSCGPYFPLCFDHHKAQSQTCSPPSETVQNFKAQMSLPSLSQTCSYRLTLVPLHPAILIYIGCPTIFYVFATRCPRYRRGGFIHVLTLISIPWRLSREEHLGPRMGKACLHIGRQTSCLFHGETFCIFTWFTFYTFGRLWFSEIICLGVNHWKCCLYTACLF